MLHGSIRSFWTNLLFRAPVVLCWKSQICRTCCSLFCWSACWLGHQVMLLPKTKNRLKYEMWQCKSCCSASRLSAACLRKLSSGGRSSRVLCCCFSLCCISWVFLQYEGRAGCENLTLNVKLYFQGTKQKQRHFIQQVVFCRSKATAYLNQI